MVNRPATILAYTLLCLLASPHTWSLTQNDVVKASLEHYPDVVNSILNMEQNKNELRSQEGSFDAKLKGGTDTRFDGYYDGKAYKVQLEKPLPYLNTRVYGGYRKSNGEFPGYEGKALTLSDGETFMGVSLSLLRDSLIDNTRYDITLAKEEVNQANSRIEQVKIDVQTMAIKAYWTWVTKGNGIEVYRNLLSLAQKRNEQIIRRIKAGDLARIYETENLQYIRKREVSLKKKLIEFQEASYYLSLFYRDKDGKPIDVTKIKIPKLQNDDLTPIKDIEKIMTRAANNNPSLKILNSMEKQAKATASLGNNLMLPKVDLSFEVNKDRGFGSKTLQGQEERLMLNIEIPLEFNKGLGKKRAGRMKMRQIQNKRSLMMEKMRVKIDSLVYKINNMIDVVKLSANQVELAEKLTKAEYRKFKRGASDLILVNIREEHLGESQIKNLESQLKYYYNKADLRRIILDFI